MLAADSLLDAWMYYYLEQFEKPSPVCGFVVSYALVVHRFPMRLWYIGFLCAYGTLVSYALVVHMSTVVF